MARKVTARGRYRKGRAVEQRIVRELRAAYPQRLVARSAGSKSGADVYIAPRFAIWFTWPQIGRVQDWTMVGNVGDLLETRPISIAVTLCDPLQVKGTEAEARRAAKKEAERGR